MEAFLCQIFFIDLLQGGKSCREIFKPLTAVFPFYYVSLSAVSFL